MVAYETFAECIDISLEAIAFRHQHPELTSTITNTAGPGDPASDQWNWERDRETTAFASIQKSEFIMHL